MSYTKMREKVLKGLNPNAELLEHYKYSILNTQYSVLNTQLWDILHSIPIEAIIRILSFRRSE